MWGIRLFTVRCSLCHANCCILYSCVNFYQAKARANPLGIASTGLHLRSRYQFLHLYTGISCDFWVPVDILKNRHLEHSVIMKSMVTSTISQSNPQLFYVYMTNIVCLTFNQDFYFQETLTEEYYKYIID